MANYIQLWYVKSITIIFRKKLWIDILYIRSNLFYWLIIEAGTNPLWNIIIGSFLFKFKTQWTQIWTFDCVSESSCQTENQSVIWVRHNCPLVKLDLGASFNYCCFLIELQNKAIYKYYLYTFMQYIYIYIYIYMNTRMESSNERVQGLTYKLQKVSHQFQCFYNFSFH